MSALVEPTALNAAPRAARFSALVAVSGPRLRNAVVRGLAGMGVRDVDEAASAAEARARALASGPRELCVIDTALPDGSGLGLLAELRSAGWTHSLVLSPHEDPYTVRAALSAGVRCFLVTPDDAPPAPLLPLRRAAGAESLSAREVEVLALVSDGRSNKEIGGELGLSALTVKSHLARIARKLGTGDRAEMVMLALRAGTIS